MSRQLSPWEKIMRAYKRNTGLRLSADEIGQLGRDSTIETAAENHRAARDGEATGISPSSPCCKHQTWLGNRSTGAIFCADCGAPATNKET